MAKPKLIVIMEGGLIRSILSNTDDIDILVADLDFEGADEDELMPDEEVKEFVGGDTMNYIDWKGGVMDTAMFD